MATNFEHIIHKNSNVTVEGNPKLPTSLQLAYGELAINYAEDYETISIKNSNNDIVTFSPDNRLVQKEEFTANEEVTSAALNDLNTRVETLEEAPVGDVNVIETVKVNNTALVPDSNKAVNVSVPTQLSELTDDTTHRIVTDAEKTTWNGKYSKPSTGIPDTDLSSGVQASLALANTAIQSETSLSKGTTTGNGNAVTDISVNGHEITLTKGSTFLTEHQSIKTINGQTITGSGNIEISGLPQVSAIDNGKILMVVNGAWALVSPSTIYTGSGTPSSSQGNDGDIYLETT